MFHILVVDDDKNIRILMKEILEEENYTVSTAADGNAALEVMDKEHIDLVILDIMMPNMDGYEFTKVLRECQNNLPILMVSAKQLPADWKKGYRLGIDDYMSKPVDEEELILRIRALLRRARIASERRLVIGSTELNYDALTVKCGDTSQVLPQKEFQLLYQLLSYPNKIFTRLQLLEEIWGPASDSMESTVSVHINRLRKRFDQNPDFQIVTIRGLGYKAQILEAES